MSSTAPQDITIGEVRFRIVPFDAFRQLRLFGDLQKEILPSVGGVLSAAFGKDDEQRDEKAAIEAFRNLSANFDGVTLERWAKLLIDPEHITFEDDRGQPQKLSTLNRDMALPDFAAVLELMFHVGRVNFAAPLSRWAALTGLVQKAKAFLPASSPTKSSANS